MSDQTEAIGSCWREVPGIRRSLVGLSGSVPYQECRWCDHAFDGHTHNCPIPQLEAVKAREEAAWGLIANAPDWNVADDGTPCGNRAKTWREAAVRWRDDWHKTLAAPEPPGESPQ